MAQGKQRVTKGKRFKVYADYTRKQGVKICKPQDEPALIVTCPDCGLCYSRHTHTVCPNCFAWPKLKE